MCRLKLHNADFTLGHGCIPDILFCSRRSKEKKGVRIGNKYFDFENGILLSKPFDYDGGI